ncbi:tetratricopeptide repeat protein [Aspergillus rambellii]|uniref:Tetratricopeptide repeat protein n=1 Tax=Aspergillus rambellii TaxID=308745 RepID=A0A0F8UWF9_9EURO|nr:tetratricopeptide repeat protein [Aspergillus rambellii]
MSTTDPFKKQRDRRNSASSNSEEEDIFHDAHFPVEEETRLLEESRTIKAEANKLYSVASYNQAISTYDRALASCPNYLDYEVAVLRSNMAACYLKMEDWKAAVDSATACIECLDRVIPPPTQPEKEEDSGTQKQNSESTEAVVEISGEDEEDELKELERLQKMDEKRADIMRIRAKALMRRAKAKTQLGGWGSLQGAEEDYKALAAMDNLPADDKRIVNRALRELPETIKKARENEMAEMMGKLKEASLCNNCNLGNGILKPFGLSTDNFNFVQDPKTGGYSMNFQS